MTFKNILIVVLVVGGIIIGLFASNGNVPKEKQDENIPENAAMIKTFTWRFEEAKTLNPDGNPAWDVYLELTYDDGVVEKKFIETVPGGCSILPEADADSLPGTQNAQCYYAGAGQRYKIVKGDNKYRILRQPFEEGSPDYDPPVQNYNVDTEIPF